jgi:hypothetical protein
VKWLIVTVLVGGIASFAEGKGDVLWRGERSDISETEIGISPVLEYVSIFDAGSRPSVPDREPSGATLMRFLDIARALGAAFHETAHNECIHGLGGLLRSHTGTMNRVKKTTFKTKAQ